MTQLCFALTTCPSGPEAEQLATTLLAERLIACANIIPGIVSLYHWKGTLERDEEKYLVLKTGEHLLAELEKRVMELHPYEVPFFAVVRPDAITEKYLTWLSGEIRKP